MAFVNRGSAGYQPMPFPFTPSMGEFSHADEKGLFYRDDTRNYHLALELERLYGGELATSDLSLDALQYWVEQGWKKPHNTPDALKYWKDKIAEEWSELYHAFESDDVSGMVKESGDVMFSTIALADNDSAVVDSSLKNDLYAYLMGISLFRDGERVETPWRDEVAKVAIKHNGITIGDVDTIIAAGFEPLPATAMNLYDDEENMSVIEAIGTLGMLSGAMVAGAQYRRDHGERNFDPKVEEMMMQVTGNIQLGIIIARAVLNVAYIAHKCGSSFEECASLTMDKVNARVQANRVGKEDGERSEDLL